MKTYVESEAAISAGGTWRYWLKRRWDDGPLLVFVGLNPSTADGTLDDPTIRRCVGFAKREGYGGLLMVNLYAMRSTDPRALDRVPYSVAEGPENKAAVLECCRARTVVLSWGGSLPRNPSLLGVKNDLVRDLIGVAARVLCFGRTRTGEPRHPLYLRKDQELVEY